MMAPNPPGGDRWRELEALFALALELPSDARETLLDSPRVREAGLRDELVSLLHAERQAGGFLLESAARELMPRIAFAEAVEGRRFGAYRAIAEIGRGGMGTVYRAVRDDAAFDRVVALKVLSTAAELSSFQERFRRERQILASLDHPGIARLIDGGTDERGQPYYVMELVEGVPIDLYCRQHRLGLAARLALLQQACEAVQFAHSKLVVHRDLKPANLLVTEDGAVKLLDFGIAGLLEPGGGEGGGVAPATCLWMTPEYASPEQVRGEAVGIATDVYALGVILYELLTGRRPYELGTRSPQEMSRAICEQVPLPPSRVVAPGGASREWPPPETACGALPGDDPRRLRRQLAGDLDTIVLRALAKEPERRYGTVRELAEDLERYRGGRPVRARPDRFAYRLGKLVRRNRVAVALGSVAMLSLVVGLAATIREAGIARQQRLAAERRFDDVRRLAGTFIFEIHDAVAALPGATPVRKLIVERALEYLARLESEGAADPALQDELASAYERIADVQGGVGVANLGDLDGALASRRRALELRQAAARSSSDVAFQLRLARSHSKLGDLLEEAGDRAGRRRHYAEAMALRSAASVRAPDDPAVARALAAGVWDAAQLNVDEGDLVAGLAGFEEALARYRRLAGVGGEAGDRRNLALALKKVGAVRAATGDLAGARSVLGEALAIDRERLALAPDDPQVLLDVSFDEGDLGHVLLRSGEARGAVAHYSRAVDLRLVVARADPQDVRAQRVLETARRRLASALAAAAPAGPARCSAVRADLERAQAIWGELEAETPLDAEAAAEQAAVADRLRRCRPD